MPTFIRVSGPYGIVLTVLAVVVVFLAARSAILATASAERRGDALDRSLGALLFWGAVAAMLGFLGQCHGAYQAVTAILAATEISAAVVAEGFVISFVPTLYGLAILLFAVAAWSAVKLLTRPRRSRVAGVGRELVLSAGVILLSGCGAPMDETPADLTEGVWVLDAPPDQFLWDFRTDAGDLTCVVHAIRGPVHRNDTPCRTAESDGRSVRVTMDTGVGVEGEVELGRRRIRGRLVYASGDQEATFAWRPVAAYPQLTARNDPEPWSYRTPTPRDDGWSVSAAADAGVSPEALEALVAAVDRGDAGILHGLLVARGGRLVLEEYFHGYGPDDLHDLRSCTKSVSSLLVGLAIQTGSIAGVGTPLLDFFPGQTDGTGDGWDALTLEHLLTMSMALDLSAEEAESMHGTGPTFFREVLSRSVTGRPGQDWAYVSANVNLLAGVLRHATGEHAEAFARHALFEPLGIGAWDWSGLETEGYNLMDGSLRLRPRDMAKLGQLVLDGGRWRGRQVVDEGWMAASTARHLAAGDGVEGYGYLWWRMQAPGPDGSPVEAVFANGWGSQFIVVFPALDLVVVTTGGNDYNDKHMAVTELLVRVLLPGVAAEST